MQIPRCTFKNVIDSVVINFSYKVGFAIVDFIFENTLNQIMSPETVSAACRTGLSANVVGHRYYLLNECDVTAYECGQTDEIYNCRTNIEKRNSCDEPFAASIKTLRGIRLNPLRRLPD